MKPADPTSLDNLRDIVEAEAVSWWPLAAGWWVLIVVAVIAACAFTVRSWRHYRRNAYRRSAMRQLRSANTDAQIARILKQTALAAYSRDEVAALTGSDWIQWLEKTGDAPCPPRTANRLTDAIFASANAGVSLDLRDFVAAWIGNHQGASHVRL